MPITLNTFLDKWYFRDKTIAIVKWNAFDEGVEAGIGFDDFLVNHDAWFMLAPQPDACGYQCRVYLKDEFAFAEVKGFMFMDDVLVIGIGDQVEGATE